MTHEICPMQLGKTPGAGGRGDAEELLVGVPKVNEKLEFHYTLGRAVHVSPF